ncbi:hypothetical protein FCM35_KLT13891 [Carex littledalei]|uniref:Uncharacterized protein n=1 Tax=Carex littledalei TaxID=544730 RepID=A0A833VDN0_9POAL|nr:hypothetical protein FCM35_KLT13891 [Carex littledalei]
MGLSCSCFAGLESKAVPMKSKSPKGGNEKASKVLEKGGRLMENAKRKESAPLVVYHFPMQSRPGLL